MNNDISNQPSKPFRLRSYVCRNGRRTAAQDQAYAELLPRFGLQLKDGWLDGEKVFGRNAPRFLEIGFGSGQSLLALAKAHPEWDFIGVETHRPGIGALLLGMQTDQLTNIRIYYHDAIDVLEKCLPDGSLQGVQLFFPDPWPKRRHHPRRLVQPEFVRRVTEKLQVAGTFHLATDWEDYAMHMRHVVSGEAQLENVKGFQSFADRSIYRPIVTKFERRALREGRNIWELQFAKLSPSR